MTTLQKDKEKSKKLQKLVAEGIYKYTETPYSDSFFEEYTPTEKGKKMGYKWDCIEY